MNKLMLSLTVFVCFCLISEVEAIISSEIFAPAVNQTSVSSRVQRFERNEYHFLGLKRLEKYYSMPENAKSYMNGAEKAFFELFFTIDRSCAWKVNDDSRQNLKYFADKQLEKFEERVSFEKIMITDGKKELDFISYVYTLDLFLYYGMLPLDMETVIDDACTGIEKFLYKTAEILLRSEELFIPLLSEHKRQIIDAFCSHDVNISDVKFINFGSELSEEEKAWRKRENLERFFQLGMQLPIGLFIKREDNSEEYILNNSSVLSRFFEILSPGTPCKRSEGKTRYNALLDCLEVNLERSRLRHTLFDFPGARSDVYGRYLVDPERIEVSCFEPFFHEGGHALSEPFTAIFEILEEAETEKEDLTMRAASCFFDSSESRISKNSWGVLSRLERDKNTVLAHPVKYMDAKGMTIQEVYEYICKSEGKENYLPTDLESFSKFLQKYAVSRERTAKFLFGENREIMQILGLRIHGGVLYVNELSDFVLYAEQRLPIRTDHLVEQKLRWRGVSTVEKNVEEHVTCSAGQKYQAQTGAVSLGKPLVISKEFSSLSEDAFLSVVEIVLLNLVKRPESFIHYKLRMNHDFMALLFELYELNIIDYEREMRERMAKINIRNDIMLNKDNKELKSRLCC